MAAECFFTSSNLRRCLYSLRVSPLRRLLFAFDFFALERFFAFDFFAFDFFALERFFAFDFFALGFFGLRGFFAFDFFALERFFAFDFFALGFFGLRGFFGAADLPALRFLVRAAFFAALLRASFLRRFVLTAFFAPAFVPSRAVELFFFFFFLATGASPSRGESRERCARRQRIRERNRYCARGSIAERSGRVKPRACATPGACLRARSRSLQGRSIPRQLQRALLPSSKRIASPRT